MSNTKNKHSVAIVKRKIVKKDGSIIYKVKGYLSRRDEEQGLDIALDRQGYIIESL